MNEIASQKQKSSILFFAGVAFALVCIVYIITSIRQYQTAYLQYPDANEYFQIQYIAQKVFKLIIYLAFVVCVFMLYAFRSSKGVRYAIVLVVVLDQIMGIIGTVSSFSYQIHRFGKAFGVSYHTFLPSILATVIGAIIIISIFTLSVIGIIKSHIPMLILVIITTILSCVNLYSIISRTDFASLLDNILNSLQSVLYFLALYLVVLFVTSGKTKKASFKPSALPYQANGSPVNAGYGPAKQSFTPADPDAPGPFYQPVYHPAPVPAQPVASLFNNTQNPQSRQDSMESIRQLSELHSQGILTDEEFEIKKKELLDRI